MKIRINLNITPKEYHIDYQEILDVLRDNLERNFKLPCKILKFSKNIGIELAIHYNLNTNKENVTYYKYEKLIKGYIVGSLEMIGFKVNKILATKEQEKSKLKRRKVKCQHLTLVTTDQK